MNKNMQYITDATKDKPMYRTLNSKREFHFEASMTRE